MWSDYKTSMEPLEPELQTQRLEPCSKKLNSELTKTVGLLWNEKTTTHTTANPEGVDVAEDGKPEAKKQTLEVVSTTSRQRFGDTRDMSMFPHVLSVCNLRISSNGFLMSARGGMKKESQSKEMATDLSKFLKFGKEEDIDITIVVQMRLIDAYVDHLRDRRLGPSGIISKWNVINFGQKFLLYR